MDEKEKNLPEFDLEDIMKEFHDPDESGDGEDVQFPTADGAGMPAPAGETVPRDTVRLDEIAEAVKKQTPADTERFAPIGEEPDDEVQPEETVEPFSEAWEPEYEQPIGEYVPPEPIVFRPRSRLQELKRKLVAGPEKRYYELTELGLGKLQFAVLLNLIVTVLTAGSTVVYAMGAIPDDRLKLLAFWQFLSLLLSALLGSYQMIEGATDLMKGRFSLNTLLLFSFAACFADGILCLQEQRIPCCAAFSLNMTMSLWSAYQKRNTEMGQMDTMRKAIRLDSVVSMPDYYEGRPGFLRAEGQVEDFMDTYAEPSAVEKTMSVYAVAALLASVCIGVVAGVLHSVSMGLQAFAASLLVSVPATSYVTLSRPMAILERRLHKLGVVLCGWQGIRGLCGSAVYPLRDADLFPAGSVKMNGVKFYGHRDPDEVVAYAAALMAADGDGTAPLFAQLLDSRSGYHYDAESLRYYNGGIGGEVNGEAVLMGTLSFMQDMGVEMPEGTRVNQAVYAAVDGELCGVFAVTYSKVKDSAIGLTTLCSYRRLTPVLVTGDFMLTESFLRSRFGINTRRMAFPDRAVRAELANTEPDGDLPALALTTGEGLAGAAYAVTGARALRMASVTGVAVHMIGGILGIAMMLILSLVGADHLLSPVNLLLYELIWMIPGLLITEWTRAV